MPSFSSSATCAAETTGVAPSCLSMKNHPIAKGRATSSTTTISWRRLTSAHHEVTLVAAGGLDAALVQGHAREVAAGAARRERTAEAPGCLAARRLDLRELLECATAASLDLHLHLPAPGWDGLDGARVVDRLPAAEHRVVVLRSARGGRLVAPALEVQ